MEVSSDVKKRHFFNVSQEEGFEAAHLAKCFLLGTTNKVIVETMNVVKL